MIIKKANIKINLIVALGNVGKSYINTRHNAGFLFANVLKSHLKAKSLNSNIESDKLYKSIFYPSLNLCIIEPLTMMNNSGLAVQKYIKMHEGNKFSPSILLVHDDLDLHLEEYKLQFGKSPKSHNGVVSVENLLGGNKDFWRLRIGIDNRNAASRDIGLEYVLNKFSQDELLKLKTLFEKIIQEEFTIS
jgi:peptidyl-tRNA hydrolase, PTH1 family